ncbi:MAG: PspC domain-containing protein [Hyphomonadaceae bacterium]|nr:PspC domain-containing protein [Hyphomonadaceae bacterium]
MERVVTVNLNGHAYTIDETAFSRLKAYLDRARAALEGNPDRDEILRDLEQAIADKCRAQLSAQRSVISDADVAQALEEMGPVEGADAPGAERADAGAQEPPRKRLYRVRDGAMISGVCSGVGAYFDIDANIIRVLFIVAALISGGGALLVYIAMMFIVPSANTREEWAQAHGLPFNAQEVIERAKQDYARFSSENGWGGRTRRKWRRRYREWRAAQAAAEPQPAPPQGVIGYTGRVLAGLLAVILTIIGATLAIGFLFALFSLLTAGGVLGWAPPASVPLWFAVIVLLIAYGVASTPFAIGRRWARATAHGYPMRHSEWRRGDDGFGMVFGVALVAAVAYWVSPEARAWMMQIPQMTRDLWASIAAWL